MPGNLDNALLGDRARFIERLKNRFCRASRKGKGAEGK
jgi:hypothetical protein